MERARCLNLDSRERIGKVRLVPPTVVICDSGGNVRGDSH
ncbi:hypothetical protein E2C01_094065 [Portunus trituberculatus]|uniref:Uncharacterized protein n=1 Tax=Portunus trituberculatus TaxID=210409 RepID=A0A5B7JVY1_PORTR|nr:hypothetical protein [Portunus trituberculatus]